MATVIITQGLPAAGKSTIIKRDYAEARVISPDVWKERHPDYDRLNPGPLHHWSKVEAEKEWQAVLAEGPETPETVIYAGTASQVTSASKRIIEAQAAGFRVVLVQVLVSIETSLKRDALRGVNGRTVGRKVIVEKAQELATAREVLSSIVDEVRVVHND